MSRTLSPQKDEAILSAAVALLLKAGYAGLSMEAVATSAGVSKRTLYKRYANKEALIGAAATRLFARLRATLPTAPSQQKDASAALVEFAESVVDFLLDPTVSDVLRVVIAESHRQPALGKAFVENGKAPIERELAGFLRNCTELEVTEPKTAAAHFLGMLKEVAVWPPLLSPADSLSPRARRSAIVSVVQTFMRAQLRKA
jgi:AcrR family transcriptional regulator